MSRLPFTFAPPAQAPLEAFSTWTGFAVYLLALALFSGAGGALFAALLIWLN